VNIKIYKWQNIDLMCRIYLRGMVTNNSHELAFLYRGVYLSCNVAWNINGLPWWELRLLDASSKVGLEVDAEKFNYALYVRVSSPECWEMLSYKSKNS
jgi:tRNA(His) 5'-end guanylyltransferase